MADSNAGRLQALEDREAIRNLIASYGPLADSGDGEGVAMLWTEEGVYAVDGFPEARGHAAIAGLITGAVHQALMARGCAHVLGAPVIDLDGDRATALCHSVVLAKTDERWEAVRVAANRWELARTPAGWRVTRRDNALLDGRGAARALLAR
ncbi:nuclear transport factor 2 family protein [Porphyrobacter sp. HT-58-2]|uniref:nuclear transport factor 2 family protein n=1 Tax=Porphyrobacter sp. HT-58-2 TaxID=2023229 RepID=UPI001F45493B|nr:nuclear transport factor 2 family protein [Porphyrobacter sp. HT-58-2]